MMTSRIAVLATLTAIGAVAVPSPTLAVAGPTGPAIPGTERADTVVTVISPGEPSSTLDLRTPFAVGMVGRTTSSTWERGSDTYSEGSWSESSDWELIVDAVGTDEVTEVGADGSFMVRYVQDSGEQSMTYSNPEFDPGAIDVADVIGLPIMIDYGASRVSTGMFADIATPLSAEQTAYYEGTWFQMSVPLPAEPVGVGATWTWVQPAGLIGVSFDVLVTARLDSVAGDRYQVSATYSVDLPNAQGIELDEEVAAITAGSYSGTIAADGSISNPLDYHHREERTHTMSLTLTDGVSYEAHGQTTREYTETPVARIPVRPADRAPRRYDRMAR